jgi:hypothetical protein
MTPTVILLGGPSDQEYRRLAPAVSEWLVAEKLPVVKLDDTPYIFTPRPVTRYVRTSRHVFIHESEQ